jgi:ornithine--oxo-acid transaminase
LKSNLNIAGFLVEPIQGEAGVYVPTEGYLAAKALCAAHNVIYC